MLVLLYDNIKRIAVIRRVGRRYTEREVCGARHLQGFLGLTPLGI